MSHYSLLGGNPPANLKSALKFISEEISEDAIIITNSSFSLHNYWKNMKNYPNMQLMLAPKLEEWFANAISFYSKPTGHIQTKFEVKRKDGFKFAKTSFLFDGGIDTLCAIDPQYYNALIMLFPGSRIIKNTQFKLEELMSVCSEEQLKEVRSIIENEILLPEQLERLNREKVA